MNGAQVVNLLMGIIFTAVFSSIGWITARAINAGTDRVAKLEETVSKLVTGIAVLTQWQASTEKGMDKNSQTITQVGTNTALLAQQVESLSKWREDLEAIQRSH